MPGLTHSNELISRDEGLHCTFACELYSMIQNRVPLERVHSIVKDAVALEEQFITEALPCRLIGMNSDLMKQYIRFMADRLLTQLGYPKSYGSENPFLFMEWIGLDSKSNFFEKKDPNYVRSGVGTAKNENEFRLDADF